MKRIKIIETNQGLGGTRVQDGTWSRLLKLQNGYFKKSNNEYDFYTNDGLLIKAIKNSNDNMANRFGAKGNILYVDYCEPGLGISLMIENIDNPNEFLYKSTGYYDTLGESFFIKLAVLEPSEPIQIPVIWNFQAKYKMTDIGMLRHFLFNSIFQHPQQGELLFKINDDSEEIILIYTASYYRKLYAQMNEIFNNDSFKDDTSWYSIYFSLKDAELSKQKDNFLFFS